MHCINKAAFPNSRPPLITMTPPLSSHPGQAPDGGEQHCRQPAEGQRRLALHPAAGAHRRAAARRHRAQPDVREAPGRPGLPAAQPGGRHPESRPAGGRGALHPRQEPQSPAGGAEQEAEDPAAAVGERLAAAHLQVQL